MTDYPVTIKVPQGAVHCALSNESVGTEGCGTCVGLVVVDNSNFKHCGHIDCALIGKGNENEIRAKTTSILKCFFPTPANTVRVGYCTTSNDLSTRSIIAAINERFGARVTLRSTARDGIRARRNGTLRLLGMNDTMNRPMYAANGRASVK